MNVQDNKPLRGPKYRSRTFQEYLLRQEPVRAAEIMNGERAYNELVKDPGSPQAIAEALYHDDLTMPVPVDLPAGKTVSGFDSQSDTRITVAGNPIFGSRSE